GGGRWGGGGGGRGGPAEAQGPPRRGGGGGGTPAGRCTADGTRSRRPPAAKSSAPGGVEVPGRRASSAECGPRFGREWGGATRPGRLHRVTPRCRHLTSCRAPDRQPSTH